MIFEVEGGGRTKDGLQQIRGKQRLDVTNNSWQKPMYLHLSSLDWERFLTKIFLAKIFSAKFLFLPFPHLTALKTTPPLLSSSSVIFEVECDKQTHEPDGAHNDCSFYCITGCPVKLFLLCYLLFFPLLLIQIAKVGTFLKNSGNLLHDRHKNFENRIRNSWDNWGQSCHL